MPPLPRISRPITIPPKSTPLRIRTAEVIAVVDETSAAETAGALAGAVVVAVVGAVAADDVAVDARKVAATFRLLNMPRRRVETARAIRVVTILVVTILVVTTLVVILEAMTSAGHVALNPAI